MSVAMQVASGHSASAAKARRPVPVPMSAILANLAPSLSSRSSASRQPAVVRLAELLDLRLAAAEPPEPVDILLVRLALEIGVEQPVVGFRRVRLVGD
jgi:hypothetical protein